jgi:hypothetical protein
MKDFFISYNRADKEWAEWVAWQLEATGYVTVIQAWDFRPGSNFITEMHQATMEAERTIAILSNNYLKSQFAQSEWMAAVKPDPIGISGTLIPVRVEDCEPPGLLSGIIYIDLVGKSEEEAKTLLLDGVRRARAKPSGPPRFPNSPKPNQFPGSGTGEGQDTRDDQEGSRKGGIKELLKRKINNWIRMVVELFSPNIDYMAARADMLHKIRRMWIDGVLKDMAAPSGIPFKINIHVNEDPVSSMKAILSSRHADSVTEDICAIFDNVDHRLLILGGPGSGKTFKLLELLRDLLVRAEENPSVPIPVVLNLSSWAAWADKKKTMADWLISELMSVYGIPYRLARHWVGAEKLALLLDGLDEITAGGVEPGSESEKRAQEKSQGCRTKCLEALNKYVDRGGIWVGLCCREEEYAALGTRLHTRRDSSTARVMPLTDNQVKSFLENAGPALKSLRGAVEQDQTLREMARTPFLLMTMTIAYKEATGLNTKVIVEGGKGGEEARRRDLFEKYVRARYEKVRPSLIDRYPVEDTRHYLGELAEKMEQGDSKLFFVDQLQPNNIWLSSFDRWVYRLIVAFFLLLFIGVIVGLPTGWAIGYELSKASTTLERLGNFDLKTMYMTILFCGGIVAVGFVFSKNWGLGIALGLAVGAGRAIIRAKSTDNNSLYDWVLQGVVSAALGIGVLAPIMYLRHHERDRIRLLQRSKFYLRHAFMGVGAAILVGTTLGVILTLTHELRASLARGLSFGIVLMLILALSYGYLSSTYEIKTSPNQAMQHSIVTALWSALLCSLAGAIGFGVVYGSLLTWEHGIINTILGLSMGSISLGFGGIPVMQHLGLRIVLAIRRLMPLKLIKFLEEVRKLHLMRRVGGGYVFQHEYLRDYFRKLR